MLFTKCTPVFKFWTQYIHCEPLSSAEALVFLGFNITMRYISLYFTWRIWEHERSRWAKERVRAQWLRLILRKYNLVPRACDPRVLTTRSVGYLLKLPIYKTHKIILFKYLRALYKYI
jgi:hypothetical protein